LGLRGGLGAGLPNFIPLASLPSDTGSTSRKRSCTELDDENHDNDTVDRYDDRWFVVQSVDSDHPISKLSPFLLSKAIKSAVGTVKTLRRLRNGDFLFEVSSAVQSRIVNKLDNLAGCPVTASPHTEDPQHLQGVTRCALLVDCDKEEIISELKPQDIRESTVTIFGTNVSQKVGNQKMFLFSHLTKLVLLHYLAK